MDDYLNESGEVDFDKLNTVERDEYLKMLKLVQSAQITLDDFKKHIKHMRAAIEITLVDEPDYIYSDLLPFLKRPNPKIAQLKARLKNYLIFENFFDRPDVAKATLEGYEKKLGLKK